MLEKLVGISRESERGRADRGSKLRFTAYISFSVDLIVLAGSKA